MYLVGDLSNRDYFQEYSSVKVKEKITGEDLATAKLNDYHQVINLETLEYFDPKKNQWLKLKTVL